MSLTHIPEMNMKNFNSKIILTPLICKRDDERGEFEYYDGSTTFYGDATIKEKARKFHKTQSKYIHIKCDCKGKEHKTLKECYDSYMNTRNYLVELTKTEKANKRKIDLNISGNYIDTFKRIFFEFLVDSKNPEIRDNFRKYEMVKLNEFKWFKKCTGAHQYITKEYYEGKIKSLDYNSYYTYLLTNMKYPMYEGEEKIIETLPEKIKYGMYRCKISNEHKNPYREEKKPVDEDDDDDDEDIDELDYKVDYKLFKTNADNKYTHIDLKLARKLNYTIDMIMDDKPNALIYTNEKLVHGKDLFGDVLNHLQNIKNKCENSKAKQIVKRMQTGSWGCLCEVNTFYEDVYDDDVKNEESDDEDDDNVEEERILYDIVRYEKKKRFYFLNQKEPLGCFKSRFARLKVFMLSFGRSNLVKTIMDKNVYHHVIRTHTDSIWVKEDCKYEFDIGENIGQFKIELEARVSKINNLNDILFECEECGKTCKNKNGVENHRCL